MSFTRDDIAFLMREFDRSELAEMEAEVDGSRLSFRKYVSAAAEAETSGAEPGATGNRRDAGKVSAGASKGTDAARTDTAGDDGPDQGTADGVSHDMDGTVDGGAERGTVVRAPLAGIFYRAPREDAAPYVTEGTHVKKGDTVGLIEAMKIMSEIPAPCDGVVRKIIAENGGFAEYHAPLLVIEET